ncbi:MAG TPA: methyltransferase domain-containing protein, partial [Verrucomicrobiae bacterium]
AVIRAIGVIFAKSGPPNQLTEVKTWLRSLLNDPQEKIRRYAVAALPKLARDGNDNDEQQLLSLAKKSASDREKKHIASALSKIGGHETLRHAETLPSPARQRVQARLLRSQTASAINLDARLDDIRGFDVLLRGRAGLETFVRDEASDYVRAHGKFKLRETKPALVILSPTAPFKLAEIFSMRCFDNVAFALPLSRSSELEQLAEAITSAGALKIFRAFTTGPLRYRLDFVNKGHQRAAVRQLAERIYSLNPNLINGGGDTPWTIEIQTTAKGARIVLAPKITPDPRFAYRRRDIPAASHPPLAACMARLSGPFENEIVWDPFCGSGLELIERALLGGVSKIIGTDLSPEALEIARQNFAAANLQNIATQFVPCDFRKFDPGPVSLIITNPPMGKRVPIPNLRQLIADLFDSAARFLKPGGRLVFANPLNLSPTDPRLKRDFSQLIDFGGFHCRLEKYTLKPHQGG